MTRLRRPEPSDVTALLVFAGALTLYLSTLSRTLPWGDSPEFLAVARTLGIAHPPGYPLYTILTALAIRVPLGTPVARLAFLSAVGGALACALVSRVTWDITELTTRRSGHHPSRVLTAVGAALAGAVVALVPEIHAQSTIPEVYALAAALLTGMLALLARGELGLPGATVDPSGEASRRFDRRFVVAGLLFGIGLAHHLTILLALPGLVIMSLTRPGRSARTWLAAAGASLVVLTSYAYLPLRSAHDPAVLWAPIDSFDALVKHIGGVAYRSRLGATSLLVALHDARGVAELLVREFGWPLLAAAVCGLVLLWRASRRYAAALLVILVLTLGHAALYSIPDIGAYLVPAYVVLGLLAGLAVALMPAELGGSVRGVGAAAALAAVVAVVLVLSFPGRWSRAEARGGGADVYLDQMLDGLAANSIVLARNDETVFPLWYALHVERRRPDLSVIDVRSRAPHLERWNPTVRFPTEVQLARSFGSRETGDCPSDGRSVLPVQRYVELLVSLNADDRPISSDYELARARFLERCAPAGYLARIESGEVPARELPEPDRLVSGGPWAMWLLDDGERVEPRTVRVAASRLEEAAKLYLVRGRPSDAVGILELVTSAAPRMTKAWNDLGVAYVATGRIDDGIESLLRAAELDPAEPSTRANLFDAYRRAGRREEALASIEDAIRLDPGEPRYRTQLALYLERHGEPGRAAEVLREARNADPEDHAAVLAHGDLLARRGRYAEALSVYRAAERLDPGSPAVQSGMGRCYWAMHDVRNAVRVMRRSIELQPHNPRLRYDLAVMLRAVGEREEALAHLDAALRVLPTMWRADILRARVLSELERHGEAEAALAKAEEHGAEPRLLLKARLDAATARGDSVKAEELRAALVDTVS
ncbi:MAG: tetratricopeptide repeat protein [Candidatus Eisenbacteria bacterium]|nr:tetratricopeptide repeat protein [Candidatus Eisenbacteria bacterium]